MLPKLRQELTSSTRAFKYLTPTCAPTRVKLGTSWGGVGAKLRLELRLNISYLKRPIVKAQMTFTVTPLRAKTFKMLMVLRSIALLNPTFSQVRALIYYKY